MGSKFYTNFDSHPIDRNCDVLPIEYAITIAFSMLIGKVAGAAPIAFFPLPSKKEDLIQQFLHLIYDTKSMMINTDEECYRYVIRD